MTSYSLFLNHNHEFLGINEMTYAELNQLL